MIAVIDDTTLAKALFATISTGSLPTEMVRAITEEQYRIIIEVL